MAIKKKYAIIDIETTGGMAKRDRITEIGIVISDGEEILSTYQTLINPKRSIPKNITRITGIDDDMVSDAPAFYEVAKTVVELTEDCIFVAHNVSFDYSFIKESFARLGYTFSKKRMCTVRLSRRSFPGLKSYSLGNLIKHFNIPVESRHRALDDALAATDVFHKIIALQNQQKSFDFDVNSALKENKLPDNISIDFINNLPNSCGVYYMYDQDGTIIYIGKSIHIKQRIREHFQNVNKKSEAFIRQVHDIDYVETQSELIALVKEAHEIKKHKPSVNIALKSKSHGYAIILDHNPDGYLYLKASKKWTLSQVVIGRYKSMASAKSRIEQLSIQYGLCRKINRLSKAAHACFEYEIGLCQGACIQAELPEDYNERAAVVKFESRQLFMHGIILDLRYNPDCPSILIIENRDCIGYIIGHQENTSQFEELKENMIPIQPSPYINNLIAGYIHSRPGVQIIEMEP